MPARRIKSLYPDKGHRRHREHRSKRGRVFSGKRERYYRITHRLARENLKEQEIEKDIFSILK